MDIVIEATYDGTVAVDASETGQIISTGKVSNIKFLKGGDKIAEKELDISYYGSAITVSKFRKQIGSEHLFICNFDKLTTDEADKKYIGIPLSKSSENPQQGFSVSTHVFSTDFIMY